MTPNEVPLPPPVSADIPGLKRYIRYQWVEIELRDVKHERIVHHISEHCQ